VIPDIAGGFILGLVSTVHCLGMCGGIIGALTLNLPKSIRDSRWRMLPYVVAYNLGRVTSYVFMGAIVGAAGAELMKMLAPAHGHAILRWLAAAVMVAIGLYLAGWFPRFAMIEHIGTPIWRRLEPFGRSLLPVQSTIKAYAFGVIWGWLPCGLVYSALVWTATSSSAVQGGSFMLAFGVGTLPSMLTAGIVAGWIARLSRLPYLRQIAGLTLIVLAAATLVFMHGH
jgi:sulfite exporter TauE/SafE